MDGRYILVDGKPVEEPDLLKWGNWLQTAERHIDKTEIKDVQVSTIFLGLDYSFNDESTPILFETMIFGGKHDQYQERYTSIEDAKKGHEKAVKLVKEDTK